MLWTAFVRNETPLFSEKKWNSISCVEISLIRTWKILSCFISEISWLPYLKAVQDTATVLYAYEAFSMIRIIWTCRDGCSAFRIKDEAIWLRTFIVIDYFLETIKTKLIVSSIREGYPLACSSTFMFISCILCLHFVSCSLLCIVASDSSFLCTFPCFAHKAALPFLLFQEILSLVYSLFLFLVLSWYYIAMASFVIRNNMILYSIL